MNTLLRPSATGSNSWVKAQAHYHSKSKHMFNDLYPDLFEKYTPDTHNIFIKKQISIH